MKMRGFFACNATPFGSLFCSSMKKTLFLCKQELFTVVSALDYQTSVIFYSIHTFLFLFEVEVNL